MTAAPLFPPTAPARADGGGGAVRVRARPLRDRAPLPRAVRSRRGRTAVLVGALAVPLVAGTAVAQAAPEPPIPGDRAVTAPHVPAAAIDQRAPTGSAAGTEGLDPALALAYTLAEREAHAQGVPLSVTSGYRTPAEQQALWDDALATYGSPEEARRWVLPPHESTHVSGDAVDVGPQQGAQWLEHNGFRWGLCRTFANEWWHFELATAPGTACPPMLPDASTPH